MTAPKPVTLAAACDAYLAPNGPLGTESTRRTYGAALAQMRKRFGDGMVLAEITPEDVAGWLQEQWGGKSSGTFNIRLRAIRSAAAWWAERGWIPEGLTAKVKPKKNRSVLPAEILSPAEVKALMDAALGSSAPSRQSPTGIRNKALVMMLYRSGLRISEALSIKPGDIDHEERTIRVLHTKAGEPSTRYYHASAEAALTRWLERRKALGFNGRQPVFCTISEGPRTQPGKPVSRGYVGGMLKKSAEEAGIDKRVHPHGFRDTFAVELVRSGADIATISRLLGHKSIATTAIYLAKLSNAEAGEKLRSLDLPDVGEGEAPERDLAAEVDQLKRQLAELTQCKEAGQ